MAMGFEKIPFGLTYCVPTLSIVDQCELEWTMDECVRMSEVNVFFEEGGVCGE